MESNEKFNHLDFIKREDEDERVKYDRSDSVVGIIVLIGTLIFLLHLIFTLISEVDTVGKSPGNKPSETQVDDQPIQMEMKGWREPSTLDTVTHKKL